jgi:hypothetical protein
VPQLLHRWRLAALSRLTMLLWTTSTLLLSTLRSSLRLIVSHCVYVGVGGLIHIFDVFAMLQ